MDEILAAFDVDQVSQWVQTAGVLIIGICMAFKSIDIAKRAVSRALEYR